MILQALNDYYRRRCADPDPARRLPAFGLVDKEIPFVLDIDADGRWLPPIRDTRRKEGKKLLGQRFQVPAAVKRSSGVAANLLWDTAEYVLGVDTRGKPERVAEQHAAFQSRIKALPDDALALPGVQAVGKFLAAVDLDALVTDPLWPEILESNPVLSFRLQGEIELICQHPAIAAAAAQTEEEDGFCLVSGAHAPIERTHTAIKGVWGAQSSGANIVSFNLDAFDSYGKTQGANAPVGKPVAFAYTTALNHLLDRDSRQRVQVGDASTVFWTESLSEFETLAADLFGEPPKDDPDRGTRALVVLYQSPYTGHFVTDDDPIRFHALGLAPNAARISVRFWQTGTIAELGRRFRQYFDDLDVVRAPFDSQYLSLLRLLTAVVVQGKAENIPPRLGGELVRSVMAGENHPFPAELLGLALQRCRADQAKKHPTTGKPVRHVTHERAALIKACINRNIRWKQLSERGMTVGLDKSCTDLAYRLGRLFAAYERIQSEAAERELNRSIRDAYYGAAMTTPRAVFPRLDKLNGHHMRDLRRNKARPYLFIRNDQLLQEIASGMDAKEDWPAIMPLEAQGKFTLGYYHQRAEFFPQKADSATEATLSTEGEQK
jgi:CRISPR-associated protein Csd1